MPEVLESGYYTIRYVPEGVHPPFIGGVYATEDGLERPIKLKALTPDNAGKQVWRVSCDENNTYRITLYTLTREAPHGFAPLPNSEDSNDSLLVVDSFEPAAWEIEKADADNVWSVILPWDTPIVGATRALFDNEGKLGVKAFPVVPDIMLPTWEFIRTEPN